MAEQCMMDDQYFSLLYKNYDANSLATSNMTTNNSTHSIDEPTHVSNSANNLGWARNDNDKAWTPSLLDSRNMDAELTRRKHKICMLHDKLEQE